MITQKQSNIGGLLVAITLRPAGKMVKDGKDIEWPERRQLRLVPFEEDKNILKYSLSPSAEATILRQLDEVHWGALIELELDRKREVISVTVVADILKNFYESNLD